MKTDEATEALGRLFPEIYHSLYQRVDPRAWRPSTEALATLRHLSETGPLTVSEAADHFDRSQAAMSERIDRLMDRGLLTRFVDQRDRRRHLVWLTDEGLELMKRASQVLSPSLCRSALDAMTEEDRAALVRGMQALVAAATSPERKR